MKTPDSLDELDDAGEIAAVIGAGKRASGAGPNQKVGTGPEGEGELDDAGEIAAVLAAGKRARGGK